MRATHIPPPFFGSCVSGPFETCFCHMAVHGDSNPNYNGRNSYYNGQFPTKMAP